MAQVLNLEQIMALSKQYGPLIRALKETEKEFPAFFNDRFLVICSIDGSIIGRGCSARVRDHLTKLAIAPGFAWDGCAMAQPVGPSSPTRIDHNLWVIGKQLPFIEGVYIFLGTEDSTLSLLHWNWDSDAIIRHIALSARLYQQEMAQQDFQTDRDKLETFYALTSELAELKSPEDILAAVASRVTQLLDAGTTVVYGLNHSRAKLIPLVGYQIPQDKLSSVQFEIETDANLVANAYRTGRVTFGDRNHHYGTADSIPAFRNLGLKTVLVVPVSLHEEPLGVLVVGRYIERPFDESQAEVLAFTARQIALILKNARLQSQLQQRLEAIDQEMHLARGMQALMLPKEPVIVGNSDVVGASLSAKHLGGDYFDYFVRNGHLHVVVADVVGKGVSAALLMSILRSHIRSVLWEEPLSAASLSRISHLAYQDFKPQRAFATALLMSLNLQTQVLTLTAAGHEAPLLLREGELVQSVQRRGPSLGLFDRPIADDVLQTICLQPGDTLLAYTDGVVDALGDDGQRFGNARLVQLFAAAATGDGSVESILSRLVQGLRQHARQRGDDTTLCLWRIAHRTDGGDP